MRSRNTWTFLILLPCLVLLGAAALSIAAAPPRLPDALAQQRQLAAEHPDDPAVLNDLGNLLRLAGELQEAEDVYRRALAVDPQRPTIRFNLAVLLSQRGEQQAALEQIDQLLESAPDHAWAHYQRGVLLAAGGETEAALQAYARAFSLDPELAFDDVNPHVIDNPLVTTALLMAYNRNPAPSSVPSAYEDPARISQLLAPPVREEEAPASAEGGSGESTGAPPAGQVVPRRAPAGGAVPGGESPPRDDGGKVLSEADLEPGRNLGQATAPGAAVPGQRGADRSWTWPRASSARPQVRSYPPAGGDRTGGSRVTPPPTAAPDPRAIPRPRFRPGVRSSGRLELELVPLPEQRPASERAG